jgi:hypothetical protein
MAVHRSFLRLLVRSVNTDLLTALGHCDFNDAMIPLRLQRPHGGWDEIWHFYMANYGGFCLIVVWFFLPVLSFLTYYFRIIAPFLRKARYLKPP